VRTLTVIVLLLAVFGAGTQCVADCLTQQTVPPCHQHSKGKGSAPEPCKQVQPAADAQTIGPPATETPAPTETATVQLFATETTPPDNIQLSLRVLRL
jgi:hypothetical protein